MMAWWQAINAVDAWTVWMILASAGLYLCALLAAGGVLFRLAFPELDGAGLDRRVYRSLVRMAQSAALVGIILAGGQWGLQAGYLGGGKLAAATDPMLLGIVFDGAQGNRLILLVSGLVLSLAMYQTARLPVALCKGLGLLGAALVVLAFVQVGHTVSQPRWVLGGLLAVHLLGGSFWVASLWPLYRLADGAAETPVAAAVLTRFGQLAAIGVGGLVLAGSVLAVWLAGSVSALFTTAHGQYLIAKVAVVGMLLGLAATNKWRLVPALEGGDRRAEAGLKRSIGVEMGLVVVILSITAILTTVTSPG